MTTWHPLPRSWRARSLRARSLRARHRERLDGHHQGQGLDLRWVTDRLEDRLMRTFEIERAARADLAVSNPEAVAMLDASTAGVNAFMKSSHTLPVEYRLVEATPEPWELWHCLAVYKVRNVLMGTYERDGSPCVNKVCTTVSALSAPSR